MKIVNRQGISQTNHGMDTMGVTVYKFALGLFGLQIDFIGLLQRIDYCGPSIGCMQPLVLNFKFTFYSSAFGQSCSWYRKNMIYFCFSSPNENGGCALQTF